MRFLKPIKSWPGFGVEISIIVIGVLIALTAEEIVQRFNRAEQVKEARRAFDDQLVDSQYAALERIESSACFAKQLDRLDELLAGDTLPELDLSELGSLRLWPTSTWEAAAASGAVAYMRPQVRNLYATQFDFTKVMGQMNREEFATLAELMSIERHRAVTDVSRDRLVRDVSRLRAYNRMMTLGARQWVEGAKPLGLQLAKADLDALAKPRPCTLPDAPRAESR